MHIRQLAAIIGLAAALIALGSWVLVDRYTGGGTTETTVLDRTTLLDKFYTAASSKDLSTLKSLLASDAVIWTNGNRFVGRNAIIDEIASTPGLRVERIAPGAAWGTRGATFATTFVRFQVPVAGVNGPVAEVVEVRDGKIFRLWDFALGVTPPFTNTAVP